MQRYLFRLIPAGHSWLSPIPDGWHLQNKMVGLIPWVSKLWSVVAELSNILWCMVPCRCTKVVIWKIPVWCLTFQVYPRCVYINVQTSRICDSPFYLHSDNWALQRHSGTNPCIWKACLGIKAWSICVTWSTEYLCHSKLWFMTTGIFCIPPLLFLN